MAERGKVNVCVCVCMRAHVCVSVLVCVCQRERERERESKTFFKFKQPFLICFLVANGDGAVHRTRSFDKLGRFAK